MVPVVGQNPQTDCKAFFSWIGDGPELDGSSEWFLLYFQPLILGRAGTRMTFGCGKLV